MSVVDASHCIYVHGGSTKDKGLNDMYRFDLHKRQWLQILCH